MSSLTYNQQQLIYWITEREKIRLAKESGAPAPWSSDPVMQSTYFCNVNREDDKVSRWIRTNIPYLGEKDNYTLSITFARIFNLIETLDQVGRVWNDTSLRRAKAKLNQLRSQGTVIYNGAYMVTTGNKKVDKLDYFFDSFEDLLFAGDVLEGCSTLKQAHSALIEIQGVGEFLAGQIVADLKNTEGHWLTKAKDWKTFSVPGPGSLKGLSWFWESQITRKAYENAIQDALDVIYLHLPDKILDVLCMQNLQNCFCEYDKFMRVSTGAGRSKRTYKKGTKQ